MHLDIFFHFYRFSVHLNGENDLQIKIGGVECCLFSLGHV